ncbi:MAG: ABC transporter permease [Bryobacteraceae bacterium]
MRPFFSLVSCLRGLFALRSGQEFEQELDEHLKLLAARFEGQGMPPEDARYAARRQFGNLAQLKERHREARGIPFVEIVLRDLGSGLRQLRGRPGFSLIAITVLALGIGANTAIFSVVNGILLRPLPFAHPERLVALFERDVVDNNPYNTVAPANFLDWQKKSTTLEYIAATSLTSFNLSGSSKESGAEMVDGCGISSNFFETLGVAPVMGRTFSPVEDTPGGSPVAIIGYGLWQRRFGGSADVLSKRIRLDGKMFSVVGVMPRDFRYPTRSIQVWIPLEQHLPVTVLEAHDNHVLSSTIGRLRAGATVEQAREEIDSIVKRYKRQHPEEVMGKGGNVVPLAAFTLKDIRTSLLLLFAAVACVLLIACVNVANLLLTRALGRKRELAIRAAIGASRRRIIWQLLVESSVLSLFGAAGGLLLASSLTGYLAANMPDAAWLPQSAQVHVDVWVFLFSLGLAVATGILAGLFPALQMSRLDLANDLKDAGRANTPARRQNRLREALVATEVALSVVLLVAAGLLVRSFEQLLSKDLGLRATNTLTMRFFLPDSKYHERAQASAFLKTLEDRLQSAPGVREVGLSSCAIVSVPGYCPDTVFQIEGHPSPSGHLTDAEYQEISPDFFRAAGVPLFAGRGFTVRDGIGLDDKNPHAGQVIINREFAKRFIPSENPIGKHIKLYWFVGNMAKQTLLNYEIVGIAGDALERPDAGVEPIFYLPILDGDATEINVVLHTVAGSRVSAEARSIIRQLDPDLAVFGVQTVSELMDGTIHGRKYITLLFASFAVLAMALATVGLYGVVSWGVVERRNEIAIRMTIGATAGDVLKMIVLRGLRPVMTGVIVGLPCAAFAARLLRTQLFEIQPGDPFMFVAVPLLLVAIASLASFLPALRAVRVDPAAGLRVE